MDQTLPTREAPVAERTSYVQILRSTALIGGSSGLNLLVGIVRTKAIAMLLGPAGIGKKCLLAVAGASAAGLEVLHARASELERSSPSASYDSSWSGSAAAGRWSRCATEERNWP